VTQAPHPTRSASRPWIDSSTDGPGRDNPKIGTQLRLPSSNWVDKDRVHGGRDGRGNAAGLDDPAGGWGLWEETIVGRARLVHRFLKFTNEYPWRWTSAHVDEWSLTMTGERHLAPSTIRGYQATRQCYCTSRSADETRMSFQRCVLPLTAAGNARNVVINRDVDRGCRAHRRHRWSLQL
jgi:hypothetical protein